MSVSRSVSSFGAAPPTTVRIVSYNVLSSSLGGKDYFTSCNPEDLVPATRLQRLLAKLETETAQDSVICLQEVSLAWNGVLFAFFTQRGYAWTTHLYGHGGNGYMGVGVAWRTARLACEDVTLTRIADSLPRQRRPAPPKGLSLLRARAAALLTRVSSLLVTPSKKAEDEWASSRSKFNALAFARLRDVKTGAAFCVASYHMPCAYYAPKVMTIHVALAAQKAQELAAGSPLVLAGDWNIKPESPQYRLLTRNEVPEEGGADAPSQPEFAWEAGLKEGPLRSAYAVALGAEPEFTNFSKVKEEPVFQETLDYIFLSRHWTVVDVERLPAKGGMAGPLPSAEEPSDHVLIAARLRLA
jgi:exonuclease III